MRHARSRWSFLSKNFDVIVLTCEHGGCDVPQDHASLFRAEANVLETHRGWDIGALAVAQGLAQNLDTPLFFSTTTRLLIDLNRSLHIKSVWSEWSRPLDAIRKKAIIERHYLPYRKTVEDHLAQCV